MVIRSLVAQKWVPELSVPRKVGLTYFQSVDMAQKQSIS